MSEHKKQLQLIEESFDFDALERLLEQELIEKNLELALATQDRDKISNPESLAEAVGNVVWEQFLNQVGAVAGEDFIRENRGLTLDLRDAAHIQTTEITLRSITKNAMMIGKQIFNIMKMAS